MAGRHGGQWLENHAATAAQISQALRRARFVGIYRGDVPPGLLSSGQGILPAADLRN
jgi:putative methionine-R-sulfoxide reductase with GAF domain